jgi:hypothetical protein
MLEAAVTNGLQQLGLEQEVAESRAVHAHIRALGVLLLDGRGGRCVILLVLEQKLFLLSER